MQNWYRSAAGYAYFGELVEVGDVAIPERPGENYFWNDIKFLNRQMPWDYKPVTAMEDIRRLIRKGQETMASDPLPSDILRQIFQLEVFLENYNSREMYQLMKDEITNFNIAENREDITEEQRQIVYGLKEQMLNCF